MRIEHVFPLVRVPGQMNLNYALGRYRVDVRLWVKAVIPRRDVDVVYVEEDAAVGSVGDLGDELPLGHRALLVSEIARYVLDRERNADLSLDALDALDHVIDDGLR